MLNSALIVDLDGTLALNEHRQHYVNGETKDWEAFFNACDRDEPNIKVLEVIHRLVSSAASTENPLRVFILSGRSDLVKDKTLDWLQDYVRFEFKLVMRSAGDRRPDAELKKLFARELGLTPETVLAVIDDRSSVVAMWRKEGFTVLQVADNRF